MEHFVKNRMEMIEYHAEGMLAPQYNFRNDEMYINSRVSPGKDYTYSSQKMSADASTLDLGVPPHHSKAPVSSFDLSSAQFIVPSSRSSALSSCNSVVSSSSQVSGSSIICSGEDDFLPSLRDHSEPECQSSIPVYDKDELKILSRCLPHTKIKKIIKCSGAVNHMIGSEVPALLAIACELFVRDITSFSWDFTKRANRRTVQVQDIKSVSSKDMRFRRLLHSKKSKSRNAWAENESLEQSRAPAFDYYEDGGVYPRSIQIPTPPNIICPAQSSPECLDKSKVVQQNMQSRQLLSRETDFTHSTNQESYKSCFFPPVQYTQHNFNPTNGIFDYNSSDF